MMKVTGNFLPGCIIHIQQCRKCGQMHKSDHKLFICQESNCMGSLTADLNLRNYTEEGDHLED